MSEEADASHEGDMVSPGCTSSSQESCFKKARFAWQIKGHHKRECKSSSASCTDHSASGTKANQSYVNANSRDISAENGTTGIGSFQEFDNLRNSKVLLHEERCMKNAHETWDDLLIEAKSQETDSSVKTRHTGSVSEDASIVGSLNSELGRQLAYNSSEAPAPNLSINHVVHKRKHPILEDVNEPQKKRQSLPVNASSSVTVPNVEELSRQVVNYGGFDIATFLWQKQEMGCAIVDNVFNRTLEEMGLSPDMNAMAAGLAVVNQSIETAIMNRGLRAAQGSTQVLVEELSRTAILQDFQNTQNQLRAAFENRNLASTTVNTYRDYPILTSMIKDPGVGENSCVAEMQRAIQSERPDLKQSQETSLSDLSIVNIESFESSNSDSSDDQHDDTVHTDAREVGNASSKCAKYFDRSDKHLCCQNCRFVNENTVTHSIENRHIENMEVSDSAMSDGHQEADSILDLAVSTAIRAQGLTYQPTS